MNNEKIAEDTAHFLNSVEDGEVTMKDRNNLFKAMTIVMAIIWPLFFFMGHAGLMTLDVNINYPILIGVIPPAVMFALDELSSETKTKQQWQNDVATACGIVIFDIALVIADCGAKMAGF